MTLSKDLLQEGIYIYIIHTHTHISAVSMNIGHIAGLYLVTIDFI